MTNFIEVQGMRRLSGLLANRQLRLLLSQRRLMRSDPLSAMGTPLEALLEPEPAMLYRLFVQGSLEDIQKVKSVLGPEVYAFFEKKGLCIRKDDQIQNAGLLLNEFLGIIFFSGHHTGSDSYAHFGDDTTALLERAASMPSQEKGLVLCTGPGMDAVFLATKCNQVDAVELVPGVAEIAEINIRLSAQTDRICMKTGDLWEPVAGQRYDLILANPPFSPSLWDAAVDRAAIGGPDGLDVARRIWDGATRHLNPGGCLAQMLGILGNSKLPFVLDELKSHATANGLRHTLYSVASPQRVENLSIPLRQTEPVSLRKSQIAAGAARMGSTHYHTCVVVTEQACVPSVMLLPYNYTLSDRLKAYRSTR